MACVSSSTSHSVSTSCCPPWKSPSPPRDLARPNPCVPDPRPFRDSYMLTALVARLPSSLPAPLPLVLFAVACVGNLIIIIAIHNFFYGSALPRAVSSAIRYAISLLAVVLPALFWYAYGFD